MAPKSRAPDLAYALPQWWCTTWQKIDTVVQPAQRRYYRLCLQQDLWGQWELLRSWGRIGQAPTRIVQEIVDSPEAAQTIRAAVEKTRQRHGYQIQSHARTSG